MKLYVKDENDTSYHFKDLEKNRWLYIFSYRLYPLFSFPQIK